MKSSVLGIDIPVDETEDGLFIIRHATLERILMEHSRFEINTHPVAVNPNMVVVECTITDKETGKKAFKVGESSPRTLKNEISLDYPAILAYQRAIDRAAILILGLESSKVYSNNEISNAKIKKSAESQPNITKEPTQHMAEPEKPADTKTEVPQTQEISDDTVILLGSCRGKKFGDVKNTPAFKQFLNWAKNTVSAYPDAARNKQLQYFKAFKEA